VLYPSGVPLVAHSLEELQALGLKYEDVGYTDLEETYE
jgi:hypothetical protein